MRREGKKGKMKSKSLTLKTYRISRFGYALGPYIHESIVTAYIGD